MARKKLNFEEALDRLEAIVDQLEGGELSLEQSLGIFEEGVKLARFCGLQLTEAERKVARLLDEENGTATRRRPPADGEAIEDSAAGEEQNGRLFDS